MPMLRYSNHARKRMAERGISASEVEATHQLPDSTYPDGGGNLNRIREVGDKRVRIVTSGADPDFIITVMDQKD